MASAPPLTEIETTTWTAVDLVDRFGAIPVSRILNPPEPGTATVEDVIRLHDEQNRLFELIDGTLVEKTMGAHESYLGLQLGAILTAYVQGLNTGIVLGADGMLRLFPNQVRIPDVSFLSWQRLTGSGFPRKAVPEMVPDLAVEVLSGSNTDQEMDRKLEDYFTAGVRLVWFVDGSDKTVRVYTATDCCIVFRESDSLSGGDVLPGFELPLKQLFSEPWKPHIG